MMRKAWKVWILAAATAASGCGSCRGKPAEPPQTGLKVQVKNAAGAPVLSRVAVLPATAGGGYAAPVTEAWVQATTTGTIITVPAGAYIVRAQGTGDSFLQADAVVKADKLTAVTLGFATLVLDGSGLAAQGRVRVWQKNASGEQIVVTRLVRPGEQAAVELAAGSYRVGFLPEGLTDEDANFKAFGGPIALDSGDTQTVAVKP